VWYRWLSVCESRRRLLLSGEIASPALGDVGEFDEARWP
jgi:hypothetical protein